jgi:hypothetical protein
MPFREPGRRDEPGDLQIRQVVNGRLAVPSDLLLRLPAGTAGVPDHESNVSTVGVGGDELLLRGGWEPLE